MCGKKTFKQKLSDRFGTRMFVFVGGFLVSAVFSVMILSTSGEKVKYKDVSVQQNVKIGQVIKSIQLSYMEMCEEINEPKREA